MFKIEVVTTKGWRDTGFSYDDVAVAVIHANDLWQQSIGPDFRVVNTIDGGVLYTTEEG